MLIISKKQVSSHFPESQSSTLAKLMMKEKEDLDLSADDNDVHSWLDALNEISILRIRKNFLNKSFLRFGYEVSFEALDKGAIEILGPYGISYTFRRLAERISQLQSGFVVRRVRYDPWPPAWWGRLLRCGEDIRGSCEWRFPCGEPDEGRPSRPVRRAGISRPYYHYAFAMLLGSTLFVTFSRECCESKTPLAKWEGEIEFLAIGSEASGSSGKTSLG
ncbi:hypothetical protein QYF36_011111 [Acer negundo]|nr:hypothetical protein QYF36_011111 [Acer negundo]